MLMLQVAGGIILACIVISVWNWMARSRARCRLIDYRHKKLAAVVEAAANEMSAGKDDQEKEAIAAFLYQIKDQLKLANAADQFGQFPREKSMAVLSNYKYEDVSNKIAAIVKMKIAMKDYKWESINTI